MCGILGYFGRAARPWPDLGAWLPSVRHRGPDDQGVLQHERAGVAAGLAHARLSIIDLSAAGHQPMASSDGRYHVVFNGEIYNFRALRGELQAHGYVFSSHSDTEVLLALIAVWGVRGLVRLRGMFAFAVFDEQEESLLLVRDRLGVKPLYVADVEGGILFASELRALLQTELVPRRVSGPGLRSLLAFGSVAEPHTIVEGIAMLPPGSWLRVGRHGQTRGEYYRLPVQGSIALAEPSEWPTRVRDHLAEAVRLRLEADVPVGVFLSGGVDSAAVAILAARQAAAPLHTFTVTFDGGVDEAQAARDLARHLGTTHHEAHLSAAAMGNEIESAVAALDQPSVDGINTFFVSRAARAAGLRVALSGIGGDELFAGYGAFSRFARLARARPLLARMPSAGAAMLEHVDRARGLPVGARKVLAGAASGGSAGRVYLALRSVFSPGQVARVAPDLPPDVSFDSELARRVDEGLGGGWLDALNAFGVLELGHYMRNTLLRDTDVMSMAHGLEVREPLLDHELIELVMRVPQTAKRKGTGNKPLLTSAVPEIPRRASHEPKKGFTLPIEAWMRSSLRSWTEDRLLADGLWDRAEVSRLWRGFLEGSSEISWSRLWLLAVTTDVLRRYRLH